MENPDADHENRTIWAPTDETPSTLNFYTGDVDDLRRVLRVRVWAAGDAPPEMRRDYAMDRIAGVHLVAGCDTTALMFRSTASVPALTAPSPRGAPV